MRNWIMHSKKALILLIQQNCILFQLKQKHGHEVQIQLTRSQSDAIEPLILWLCKHLQQRELVAGGAT